MNRQLTTLTIAFCCCMLMLAASPFEPATNTFFIPETPPDVVITANTMSVKNDVATLEGNVKATREGDILTCNRALVSNSPQWLIASLTPKLYRREAIAEKKVIRELNLEARSIYWNNETGKFNASDSVNVRIEERSWDLATYSWVIITADEMVGYRDNNRMIFSGNVKIREQNRFGRGNRLDYLQETSTAILSGNAMIQTQEKNKKTGKLEKRTIEGQKITYNTENREAISE